MCQQRKKDRESFGWFKGINYNYMHRIAPGNQVGYLFLEKGKTLDRH